MSLDEKALKKLFPNLFKEITKLEENKVKIDAVRADPELAEKEVEEECGDLPESTKPPDVFRHYNPTATDFIRRCDTEAQAEEIISFLQKKGELTVKEAEEMRCQLKRDGLRSFGPKKEAGHYFKESGIA
jgi:hypothetical protein